MELETAIKQMEEICESIEEEKNYMGELKEALPAIKETVQAILAYAQKKEKTFELNVSFVLQVLKDMITGMEQEDDVLLLDTIRYGLLQIYYYTADELQSEG